MEDKRLLVSIIVRTKDRPKLLKNAIKSISEQTYRHIEVVLVNDGGCDLNAEELSNMLGDIPLNYIRLEKNMGRARAGNVGIENAEGDYIGFLDDDDEYYPEHVSTLISFLKETEYRAAYTDSLMVFKEQDSQSKELKEVKKELIFSEDYDYDKLIFENYIPFMCLMFCRETLINSGGFDISFNLYEDWDLLIRIGDKYPFLHIKKTTANYNLWSIELQISQRNRDQEFLKQSYLKIVSKHADKITPERIHHYVSKNSHPRDTLRQLSKDYEEYKNQGEIYLRKLESAVAERDARISNLEFVAMKKDAKFRAEAMGKDACISDLEAAVMEKDAVISSVESALGEKEAYIELIHSGHGWRLLTKYFRIRDSLLPAGSKKRLFAKLLSKAAARPKEVLGSLNKRNFERFFYNLKTTDPLTLEKKIEQKLSDGDARQNTYRGKAGGRNISSRTSSKDYFSSLFDMNTKRQEDYVPISYPKIPENDIRLISFYLPQFHPIRENDEWWGKGFTEWTNVSKAVPQFIGHYQPRLPGELGFYDLRIPEVQARQIELAKQYGIYGFCFHFYWFNGKTMLEKPLQQFTELFDFPFCLNWANENWTRRWDGKDSEILLAQRHSPEDDIEFIKYVSNYMTNKNYIKIKSKPLLMLYRPALLPDPKATGERWRKWCRNNGIGEIYLAAVRSFDEIDPRSIGYDALIEFPPHALPFKDISGQFNIINQNYRGVISDYKDAASFYLESVKPPYKKFKGIVPGWDNEARIPGRGKVVANSTPDVFKEWLRTLCDFTHDNFDADERMIFINAWNEWGEGAYLEPDRRYGYAYLQAVADALIEYKSLGKQKKIIHVCHDAFFAGAQLISLNIIKALKCKFRYEVHFILKSGGELESEFAKYGIVYNLERNYKTPGEKEKLIEHLYDLGVREAICNTVASGDLTKLLSEKGIKTITLVHELPDIIKRMNIGGNAQTLAVYSNKVIFPSAFVMDKFKTITKVDGAKTAIIPQGLYTTNRYKDRKETARRELRDKFSLPENARIILGVGFGDYRKGVDLFFEAANNVSQKREDIYFMWVGNLDAEIERMIKAKPDLKGKLILQSAVKDVSLFYAGADIYLLPSREDPFPSVVLEAMDVGLPVVGFRGAGGFNDIVNETTGALVPYLDVDAMSKAIISILDDARRMLELETNAQKLIEERFNFSDYIYRLLALLGQEYKKISVIIPNYNYGEYLKLRMDSIISQTYPIYEIIFLDDASTDDSMKILCRYLEDGINIRIKRNELNSGSVFKQWMKGLSMAKGDYIWIAEADDICESSMIEELMSSFNKDNEIALAYCQSKQIGEHGELLSENYLEYTNDIDRLKWRKNYIREGIKEISDTMAVKNTIPNISGVIFKKLDISHIADELPGFKIAGDWFFHIWLLKQGKIAYVSDSLNYHRRHDKGVTISEDKKLHYDEVVRMQEYVMKNFEVPPEVKKKALSYRESLKTILGLHLNLSR